MDMLPVGSVVVLKEKQSGRDKVKVVIISRMTVFDVDNEKFYFEYGGCAYPGGLIGKHIAYFNTEDIEEVLAKGYVDDEEINEVKLMEKWLETANIKKADLDIVRQMTSKKTEN